MSRPLLTQKLLLSILHYEPETGAFTWRQRPDMGRAWNTRYAGKAAGFDWEIGRCCYRSIRIFDWPFLAHRLAILYIAGEWPANGVDHRDMNGLNNRWSNLRHATKSENSGNTRRGKRNKSGFKGVCRCSRTNKFRANIGIDGKQQFLGNFDTAEEAHAAYRLAAVVRYGEFARFE